MREASVCPWLWCVPWTLRFPLAVWIAGDRVRLACGVCARGARRCG